MSVLLNINGNDYPYPEPLDLNWGQDATDWAIAVTSGMLQKAGGVFQLLGEVDFGTSYGLKSLYYKSRGTNVASTGVLRLANAETIAWRNNANSADLALTVNSSNDLLFNGSPIGAVGSIIDTDSIDLTLVASALSADLNLSAASPSAGSQAVALSIENDGLLAQISDTDIQSTISVASTSTILMSYVGGEISSTIANNSINNLMVSASAAIAYSKLDLSDSIVNADINSAAAIAYSKLSLTGSIVNADISASAAIGYSKLSLTNSIVNADIASGAAIARSKLAAGTANHVIINDGSGVLSSEAQLSVSRGGTGQNSYTDGQLLIGNSSGNTLTKGNLTAGSNITITNGNGSIQIAAAGSSPAAYNVTSQTTTYSAAVNDYILCSGSSFTVTLPTAVGVGGQSILIEHNGTSTTQVYTLNTTSGQTIGSFASGAYQFYLKYQFLHVVSDGANWQIQEETYPRVAFSANTSNTAATTSAPFVFTNELLDPFNAYSTSTGIFTAPAPGVYQFSWGIYTGGTSTDTFIYINSVQTAAGSSSQSTNIANGSHMVSLAAGGTAQIRPSVNATANGSAIFNRFMGFRVSGVG